MGDAARPWCRQRGVGIVILPRGALRAGAGVLDCCRVEPFRLRFPGSEHADLNLGPGVHAIGRDGVAATAAEATTASVQFCVDRRGVWLRLTDAARGVHVNGRPVRHMAMLRVGDAIWLDGTEVLLLPADDVDRRVPESGKTARDGDDDTRLVLRGVGGQHHGRCFGLARARVVGRLPDCDIRIDEPAFAERHARLEPHGDRVLLRGIASGGSVVNGETVRDAMLRPGDQVVFDARHRFVVEAPLRRQSGDAATADAGDGVSAEAAATAGLPGSARRLPWLLLAALLIAAALGALLLFGAV